VKLPHITPHDGDEQNNDAPLSQNYKPLYGRFEETGRFGNGRSKDGFFGNSRSKDGLFGNSRTGSGRSGKSFFNSDRIKQEPSGHESFDDELIEDELVEGQPIEQEHAEDELFEYELMGDELIEDELFEGELLGEEPADDEITDDEPAEDEAIRHESAELEALGDEAKKLEPIRYVPKKHESMNHAPKKHMPIRLAPIEHAHYESEHFEDAHFENVVNVPSKRTPAWWLMVALCALLALVVVGYVGLSIFFMSHFTFNSAVNGIPVAFKTAPQVNASLESDIGSYSLRVEARDGQSATITGSQIDLQYVNDGRIEQALAQQQPWAWPFALIFGNVANVSQASVSFDQESMDATLAGLPFLDEDQMKPPLSSALAFEAGSYVITSGNEGTTLDVEKTILAITDAVKAGETTLDLEELGLYERPETPYDDATLTADKDRFNQHVPFSITYLIGNTKEVLDGYTTIDWALTAEDGSTFLNYDAVVAWVAELAKRYDTLGSERTIINGFEETKQVVDGTFGWQLDQETECWAIMNAFEQSLGEEREPHWFSRGVTFGENDWGDTYLEVDITRQYMWYFVDGECVMETDVITGNPNTGYATPQGVWYIYSKSYNVIARGDILPDGSYRWETPLTYWMPFTPSGVGFHDAYWQPSFGGTYYLERGSHGCINMPPHLAEELIEILEPGTPVITHF